jgi:hypothetical protein
MKVSAAYTRTFWPGPARAPVQWGRGGQGRKDVVGRTGTEYLTELNKHASELAASSADWMPWTYWDTLAKQAAPRNV